MLESYKKLVPFLGSVLGEHCKVALFDLTVNPPVISAIANGTLEEGNGVGAPITDVAGEIIKSGVWKTCDYKSEFLGRTRGGDVLKSSYFFIKKNNRLIAMLSINSSATQYQNLCQNFLKLSGFSGLLQVQLKEDTAEPKYYSESISRVSDRVAQIMDPYFASIGTKRLTQEEKMAAVRELSAKGIFQIKGAVPEVARTLSCSEATVYRYLSKVTKESV